MHRSQSQKGVYIFWVQGYDLLQFFFSFVKLLQLFQDHCQIISCGDVVGPGFKYNAEFIDGLIILFFLQVKEPQALVNIKVPGQLFNDRLKLADGLAVRSVRDIQLGQPFPGK